MVNRRRRRRSEGIGAFILLISILLFFVLPSDFRNYVPLFICGISALILPIAIILALIQKERIERLDAKKRQTLLFRQDLENLSPSEFEIYTDSLFQKMGYKTELQGNINASDQGIDIRAWRGGEYVIIQCKRFTGKNNVGIKDVRDLMGVVSKEKANTGFLVTSSNFTGNAQQWSQGTNIILVTPKKISDWLQEYQIGPFEQAQTLPDLNSIPKNDLNYVPSHLRPADYVQDQENKEKIQPYKPQTSKLKKWQVTFLAILSLIALSVCACTILVGLGALVEAAPK